VRGNGFEVIECRRLAGGAAERRYLVAQQFDLPLRGDGKSATNDVSDESAGRALPSSGTHVIDDIPGRQDSAPSSWVARHSLREQVSPPLAAADRQSVRRRLGDRRVCPSRRAPSACPAQGWRIGVPMPRPCREARVISSIRDDAGARKALREIESEIFIAVEPHGPGVAAIASRVPDASIELRR